MKLEYEEINGLLYPKLTLPPQNEIHLTRFGRKRLQYLKQYRPIIYTNLLTSGELNDHLQMVDDAANPPPVYYYANTPLYHLIFSCVAFIVA